jgi:hypothetical protein
MIVTVMLVTFVVMALMVVAGMFIGLGGGAQLAGRRTWFSTARTGHHPTRDEHETGERLNVLVGHRFRSWLMS